MKDTQRGRTPAPPDLSVVGVILVLAFPDRNSSNETNPSGQPSDLQDLAREVADFLSHELEPSWPSTASSLMIGQQARLLYLVDAALPLGVLERALAALSYGFGDGATFIGFEVVDPDFVRVISRCENEVVSVEMLEELAAWLPSSNQPA